MVQPANEDPRETGKFGRLASIWWDPKGAMHSLHDINPLRTEFIARSCELSNHLALDVGCGGGLLAESLARLGARVTGIDLSDDLLELARRHARAQGLVVDYRHLSAEQIAEAQPGTFDIVTCMEVLEHIPRPADIVAACSRLLRPGGHAFFSTLDRSPKSFVFAILGAEYILRLLPIGSHNYLGLIRPEELRSWAQQSGLAFANSAGVVYNPFTRKYTVAPQPDVSYMMHFTKQ